ncbi:helicase domain protein [Nitzschia inconspicua]|uniref:Helicase domain protein n=1 Tax=Nitzschia inconspicua TaxID=303405 RepID=A0A9K3KEG6_9STRA|nr:helicase domain protein [Nitzschia inconspicua]
MDYSSSSGGAIFAKSNETYTKETSTPYNNNNATDYKPNFTATSKNFPFHNPPRQTPIGLDPNSNGITNMSSNISDALRSNKRSNISMMMNSASPLVDVFSNSNNHNFSHFLNSRGAQQEFVQRLSAFTATNPAEVIANAAAALSRPQKRQKLQGDEHEEPYPRDESAPPSVVLIPSQQSQLQERRHRSDDSNGDDDGSSRGSLDSSTSPNPLSGQAMDGVNGVRFREYQAEIWSEKFEELCLFRRENGHCHVPHHYEENQALAQWVKRQRYQYKLKHEGKRSTLSDERIRLLNTIGFIWNSHDAVFAERLQDLMLFKSIHGHCMVPSNHQPNFQLAIWTKRQRRQYKKYQEGFASSMTPERIAMLEAIGFVWDCRKLNNDKKESKQSHNKSGSPISTAGTATASASGWKPSLTEGMNIALLGQQQQRLVMVQYHDQKNQLINKNHPKDRRETNNAAGDVGAPHGAEAGEEQKHSAFTTIPTAVVAGSHQSPSQQQQKPINQALLRLPKCDFFSFSGKFRY